MLSPQGNPARREPLLWLHLLGLAALPLEAAALLLVLAGADPGPLPALELLFCWSLGAAGPALLLWRLPPDLWSLLLLQVPLKGRRPDQLRLSALQGALPVRLLAAAGAPLLVPLLWWCDRTAGLAWAFSPLRSSPRLVVLLVAAALLALMLWQWQQSVQALWLLSRPATKVAQSLPLPLAEAAERRLNLGLPLLLLKPLVSQPRITTSPAVGKAREATSAEAIDPHSTEKPEPVRAPVQAMAGEIGQPSASRSGAETPAAAEDSVGYSVGAVGVDGLAGAAAVTPEQGAEHGESNDLNQQV
ncbi:MAG: low-complexity tail membrane protein [Cyanobium sp.]